MMKTTLGGITSVRLEAPKDKKAAFPPKTFKVTATDKVGNQTVVTNTYTVGYRVCTVLAAGVAKVAATINLTLCSPSGANLSDPAITR